MSRARVVWYRHHSRKVAVQAHLKGRHKEYSLCYRCRRLSLDPAEDNCPIAEALYEACLTHHIVTPVWECPGFQASRSSHVSEDDNDESKEASRLKTLLAQENEDEEDA